LLRNAALPHSLKIWLSLKKSLRITDFEILAFPSNDFGGQEPLERVAITAFCEVTATTFLFLIRYGYEARMPIPLFKFLADKKENGNLNSAPRWNFHKYLIDRKATLLIFFTHLPNQHLQKSGKGYSACWLQSK
jgi:glutathione peroxidase